MIDAFICDAIRTPIGRYGGALASVRTDDLAALPLKALMARNPAAIGVRSTMSSTAVRTRRARTTATSRAWQCCSQACRRRFQARQSTGCVVPDWTPSRLPRAPSQRRGGSADCRRRGEHEPRAVCGVQTRCRIHTRPAICDTTLGWRFVNPLIRQQYGVDSMPETAENVAERSDRARGPGCLRPAQPAAGPCGADVGTTRAGNRSGDGFRPAWRARDRRSRRTPARDEPCGAVQAGHAVSRRWNCHGGKCSGVNDGACALLVASEAAAIRHGLTPRARICGAVVVGVEPAIMGFGPAPATQKLLQRLGLQLAQIDVVELNEAFARRPSPSAPPGVAGRRRHVNPNGGAIALGHPLGMSGARLATTALVELERRGLRRASARCASESAGHRSRARACLVRVSPDAAHAPLQRGKC